MRYKLPLHKHFMQFLPCSFNYTRTAFYVEKAPFMHMSDHSLKTRLNGHKTRKPCRRMNYRESIISFRSLLASFLSCQKCTPLCQLMPGVTIYNLCIALSHTSCMCRRFQKGPSRQGMNQFFQSVLYNYIPYHIQVRTFPSLFYRKKAPFRHQGRHVP